MKASYNEKILGSTSHSSRSTSTIGGGSLPSTLASPSSAFRQKVTDKIGAAIPWTIGLLLVASLLSFLIGTIAGALMAWPKSPRALRALVAPFILLSAVPFYLLAILLIFLLSATLNLLPGAGGATPTTILGWRT